MRGSTPNLAGPHFQLYNSYRQAGRTDDEAREKKLFDDIKKLTAGAAIPEDLEWSFYSEVYERIDPADSKDEGRIPPVAFKPRALGTGVDTRSAGMTVADVDGDGKPDLIVWSSKGIQVFGQGTQSMDCGLKGLTGVVWIAAGDFNNDGLADLAIVSQGETALYENKKGRFEKSAVKLPAGRFARAIWLDYDHDYDLDLILLGETARLMRNNGADGFSDETARFPFIQGNALDAVVLDSVPDTPGLDLAVAYAGRAAVLYTDKLLGKFEAHDLPEVTAGASAVSAFDFNSDSWTDLAFVVGGQTVLLENHDGKFQGTASLRGKGQPVFADLGNRGRSDLVSPGALYRNRGLGKFSEEKVDALDAWWLPVAEDFDGDGRLDLAVVNSNGSVTLLRNISEASNKWMDVTLTRGVKNPKLAYGAKVEVIGIRYQKQIYRVDSPELRDGKLRQRPDSLVKSRGRTAWCRTN